MSEISWIKLKTEMFDDERIKLIESMPEADTILIIWVKLLIQAGKTNANGYIFLNENVPLSSEMLATLFNRPLTIVRLALNTLAEFGMISIDEAGRILIKNWTKHQNVEGMERVREQTRLRVAKHRKKLKILNNTINNNITVDTDRTINKDKELDKESCVTSNVTELKEKFDEFRKKYPGTKRGLDTEFEDFIKKHKDWKEIIPQLLPALEDQIEQRILKKNKNEFVPEWKHLRTWLSQRFWEVEIRADRSQCESVPQILEGEPGWK